MRIRRTIFVIFIAFSLQKFLIDSTYSQEKPDLEVTTNRTPIDLINLITDRQIQKNELQNGIYSRGEWKEVKESRLPKTMYWSYATGVTLLAMQRVYDITKDEKILNFVNQNNQISADYYSYLRWQKMKFGTVYKTTGIEKLWRLSMLDDCGAMGAEILESNLRYKTKFTANLHELIEIIGNYVINVQDRLTDGTLWRPNSNPEGPTIWVDDLYMSVPFLIRWSEYKKSEIFLNDAARQIINYASYLQDSDGIFFHGYYVKENTNNCCKWGRGNGWAAVAIAELLSVLPKENPQYMKVVDICKKQIDGLTKYQSASGLWNQVINHPELSWGTETSCSAQITYAIARGINKGWLDKSYISIVKKAFKGIRQQIDKNGGINKICKSTSIRNDLEYYNNRPAKYDDYHGSSLILLALTEIFHLEQRDN